MSSSSPTYEYNLGDALTKILRPRSRAWALIYDYNTIGEGDPNQGDAMLGGSVLGFVRRREV